MKHEIVKYNPELKSQIVELQKHLWGPDIALNAACLEWKYDRNPYIDTPLIYVALYEGRAVGMRGMFGAKWQIGSPCQTFVIPCAGDSVIAPEHRNQGLFGKMTRAALEDLAERGYVYIFNLSASAITYISYLTLGWRSTGSLQEMKWKAGQGAHSGAKKQLPFVSATLRRLQRYVSKLSFSASTENQSPFRCLDRNGRIRWHKASHVAVERVPRPAAMAELIERIGNDGRMQHVRDQQFFAWRFQNPRSAYRFLFWEDSRLEGYLILRTSVYANRVGVNIVDWEATSGRVRADLLQAAIHWGNFNSLTIWSETLSDEAKTILRDSGLSLRAEPKSVTDYRPSVLIRAVREEMVKGDWILVNRRLLDLNNWDLRMIYSDGN